MASYWLSSREQSASPVSEILANASYWSSESRGNNVYVTGTSQPGERVNQSATTTSSEGQSALSAQQQRTSQQSLDCYVSGGDGTGYLSRGSNVERTQTQTTSNVDPRIIDGSEYRKPLQNRKVDHNSRRPAIPSLLDLPLIELPIEVRTRRPDLTPGPGSNSSAAVTPTPMDPRINKRTSSVSPSDPRLRKVAAELSPSIADRLTTEAKQHQSPQDRPDKMTPERIHLHKLPHESSKEWQLRKQFLLAHLDDIPHNLLECLSQVFINMECFGCVYPIEVMDRVRMLSQHMTAQLDDRRSQIRQRAASVKFVKAGAGVADVKTRNSADKKRKSADVPLASKPIAFVKPNSSSTTSDACHDDPAEKRVKTDEEIVVVPDTITEKTEKVCSSKIVKPDSVKEIKRKGPKSPGRMMEPSEEMQNYMKNKALYASTDLEVIMYDIALALAKIRHENKKTYNSIEALYMAASQLQLLLDFRIEPVNSAMNCKVFVNSVFLAQGYSKTKKQAKHAAFEQAVVKLNKPYLRVVRVNPEHQELEARERPFGSARHLPSLTVLGGDGGGEVARRGMKTPLLNKPSTNNPKSSRGDSQKMSDMKSDFVLVEYAHPGDKQVNNPISILNQSAVFNNVALVTEFEKRSSAVSEPNDIGSSACQILLDDKECAVATGRTKQMARLKASGLALEKLRQHCWTIRIKPCADSSVSGLTREAVLGELSKASDSQEQQIPDTNIGSKLLKKMGWTSGTGIGKEGQGIVEPVKADTTLIRRAGFGMSSAHGHDFKANVHKTLQDYLRSRREDELKFSPEFNNGERAIVHAMAQKMGLRSRSYGQGADRYLVVARKRTPNQLFAHIMSHGGATSKYQLVPPLSQQQQPKPDE